MAASSSHVQCCRAFGIHSGNVSSTVQQPLRGCGAASGCRGMEWSETLRVFALHIGTLFQEKGNDFEVTPFSCLVKCRLQVQISNLGVRPGLQKTLDNGREAPARRDEEGRNVQGGLHGIWRCALHEQLLYDELLVATGCEVQWSKSNAIFCIGFSSCSQQQIEGREAAALGCPMKRGAPGGISGIWRSPLLAEQFHHIRLASKCREVQWRGAVGVAFADFGALFEE
mmetsp:Transcript_81968/g.180122  ORF Transcript_81968/g.180122 Transcript_81968/m.180122 type:complete len:227 (-) Transcript_81968:1452-2132(-)